MLLSTVFMHVFENFLFFFKIRFFWLGRARSASRSALADDSLSCDNALYMISLKRRRAGGASVAALPVSLRAVFADYHAESRGGKFGTGLRGRATGEAQ